MSDTIEDLNWCYDNNDFDGAFLILSALSEAEMDQVIKGVYLEAYRFIKSASVGSSQITE